MIPHPLTLLFCWLIGAGLANALGYILQFIGELCADFSRYGWIGSSAFTAALLALGFVAAFAGGLFTGAAMRLLAERDWLKAGCWTFLTLLLASWIGGVSSLGSVPRVGLALLQSRGLMLCVPPGCFLGAWLCDRYREEWRGLDAAEAFMRNWMFWERGGAL
jgi:hypothetical protein